MIDSEGHPGEDDPPPCEEVGKDVKYESLFKEDREYNQASLNTDSSFAFKASDWLVFVRV